MTTPPPPPYGGQPLPPVPPHPPAGAPQGFGPPGSGPQGFGPPSPQPAAAGPEFMVFDRHNSIVVDGDGVAFEDHGLSVEFAWQEVRSVHYKASPSGKALMMAVVHADGRFYECVVEAKPKTRLGEWFAHLAAVLGHYRPMGW